MALEVYKIDLPDEHTVTKTNDTIIFQKGLIRDM